MRPLRGFDRLAAAGFSEGDIESMRENFHQRQRGFTLSGALDADAGKFMLVSESLSKVLVQLPNTHGRSRSSGSMRSTALPPVFQVKVEKIPTVRPRTPLC
jgi:hypothetical protein